MDDGGASTCYASTIIISNVFLFVFLGCLYLEDDYYDQKQNQKNLLKYLKKRKNP